MKALENLPEGYHKIYAIDLQKNKKMSLLVNALAILIAMALMIPMHFVVPIGTWFGPDNPLLKRVIVLGLLVLYMVLHELAHGIAMKLCRTKKVKYGFTGMYAFAGSDDYYDKKSYIFIALAPIVLWGVVLAVVNLWVPIEWFGVVYMIQIVNLGGAAGDLFVTVKFSRMPSDILIRDYGVGMTVYSKENSHKEID